jgi:hypothetical protein
MLVTQLRNVTLAAVITAMAAAPAVAQEKATTLDQLRVLVSRGDRIKVTDADGHELKGRLEGLSGSELALRVGDSERRLKESEIRTIRVRKDDSLADGAWWGFATGGALGLLVGLSIYREVGAGVVPLVTGLYGGIFAGIGVGLDAMVTHDRTIYNSLGTASATKKMMSVTLASW